MYNHARLMIHTASGYLPGICLLLLVSVTLHADPPPIVKPAEIAFQPQGNYDSYIQAWNFTHFQPNLRLYITFIISNLGPGDLNNGVSILIFRNGKSKAITAEYSSRSLSASAGKVGVKSGHNYFSTCGPRCFDLAIKLDTVHVKLKITKVEYGYRMSHRELNISSDSNEFVSAYIPINSAHTTGVLDYDGNHIELSGTTGMEFLLTNRSPHKYARSITLIRSYKKDGISLGFIDATDSGLKKPGRVVVRRKGRIFYEDYISRREVISTLKDRVSGIALPALAYYYGLQKECRIKEKKHTFQGGYFVLNNVSTVLRWLLKTFFAKPYILYYASDLSLECKDSAGNYQTKIKFKNQQSSSYIINE